MVDNLPLPCYMVDEEDEFNFQFKMSSCRMADLIEEDLVPGRGDGSVLLQGFFK